MESLIERVYRRSGDRYIYVCYGWISVVAFATGFMTLVAGSAYLDVSATDVRSVAPAWIVANSVSLAIVTAMSYRHLRPALAWIRGRREASVASAAWDALVASMAPFVVRAILVFTVCAVPAEVLAARVLDLPWYGAVVIAFAVEITILAAALLDYLGVGINSGPLIVGSVGGGGRLEYTFIGDVVNVAKRVEQLTKDFGDPILLTDATRHRLTRPDHNLAARGEIAVRGKSEPLAVHAVAAALTG